MKLKPIYFFLFLIILSFLFECDLAASSKKKKKKVKKKKNKTGKKKTKRGKNNSSAPPGLLFSPMPPENNKTEIPDVYPVPPQDLVAQNVTKLSTVI
ncbi:hypothetical protein TcasGA2_TC015736 [Tribolium castaneum]|uniref:Uncharacterized protein n=1 Tax=Tribolium castaneum TaxID=7070 RepID=D2A3R0_TRICA|nr:hypothetical protein TcasGA2_TC015736 [Tribolium castaneum]